MTEHSEGIVGKIKKQAQDIIECYQLYKDRLEHEDQQLDDFVSEIISVISDEARALIHRLPQGAPSTTIDLRAFTKSKYSKDLFENSNFVARMKIALAILATEIGMEKIEIQLSGAQGKYASSAYICKIKIVTSEHQSGMTENRAESLTLTNQEDESDTDQGCSSW